MSMCVKCFSIYIYSGNCTYIPKNKSFSYNILQYKLSTDLYRYLYIRNHCARDNGGPRGVLAIGLVYSHGLLS